MFLGKNKTAKGGFRQRRIRLKRKKQILFEALPTPHREASLDLFTEAGAVFANSVESRGLFYGGKRL
jgi:hypothetical protein